MAEAGDPLSTIASMMALTSVWVMSQKRSSLPRRYELSLEYPLSLEPSPRVNFRVAIDESIDDGREEVRLVPVALNLLVDCRISAIRNRKQRRPCAFPSLSQPHIGVTPQRQAASCAPNTVVDEEGLGTVRRDPNPKASYTAVVHVHLAPWHRRQATQRQVRELSGWHAEVAERLR